MDKHESLVKEFQSLGPPVFSGSSDISVAEEWFREIEKKLGLMRLTDEERLILATSMLKGEASHWWDINRHTMVVEGMTWREFENSFLETYYPFSDRNMKKIELLARMEYLNRLEKKRDRGEPKSSETTNSAVEMENLECNEIGGDVRMQQAHQAIQDRAPMEIVVRNLTMNGGQGTVKSSNLNSETHLQLQRKQPKPELAVVEVSIEMKETRQESGHTMINIGEQQKQLQQNMKKYMHQLLSQKVQPLLQRKQQLPLALVESIVTEQKQQQPLALVESIVTEQKQQQPLALVESNVKEQKQQQQLALVDSNVKEQKQQQLEVAVVDGTANMIETQQQPEVAHAGSNIEEQQKELQLQKKHYMHRVLLQRVQQLLQRKQQQLQPQHWKQLLHWQQLQQRQEELQQQIQQQQQLHQQQQQQKQQQLQQMQQQQQQKQLQQQQQQLQLQKKHYMHRVLFQRVQQLLHRKQQLQPEHWKQLRHWQQLQQRQEELQQQIQRQHQQLHQQRQQQQQKQQQLQQMQWQQHQELQQLHQQQHHQLHQLHQQRQQQKQKQQQLQQQKQEHHKPKNERKQNKKRKHHEAEVALVQVNMEEFWANELNRKKAVKVKKQVQKMD